MKWLTNLIMPKWMRFLLMVVLPLVILAGLIYYIYHSGELAERDRNVAAENAKLVQYGQRILTLQTQARETERAHVIKVNDLTTYYEKRIYEKHLNTQSALRDVATGTRKLRIGTNPTVQACRSETSTVSPIAAPVAEGSAELSREAAEFLINLTGECDATAEKLNLAIDIARSDRAIPIALTNKEIDQ